VAATSDVSHDDTSSWDDYYEAQRGRTPRALFLRGLELLDGDPWTGDRAPLAIDLGSGDGTESVELLRRGWRVLAVDQEVAAIRRLRARVPAGVRDRLEAVAVRFEAATIPPCRLVYAGYSLPFCGPSAFARVWRGISDALTPGGGFVGHLFGDRDTWAELPDLNFHTRDDVADLLADWDVLHLEEVDEDGDSFAGPKHWHVFRIVASRPRS
jgi:tellurite methyltransferase